MADKKITELSQLVEASVNAADVLAIADISAAETRKITTKALAEAGVRIMADGAIPFSKVDTSGGTLDGNSLIDGSIGKDQIGAGAVGTDELADDAVTTDKIATDAVTTDSIADGLDGSVLADGSVRGQKLADQTVTNEKISDGTITGGKIAAATIDGSNLKLNTVTGDHIDSNAISSEELADEAVDTAALQDQSVTGPKLNAAAFNRGLDQDVDGIVGITNVIDPGTHAGITYTEQGLISGITTPVPAADLPTATATDLGVVMVPADGGLSVAGTGAVTINNTVEAGTGTKISYTDKGLVTGAQPLEPEDIPIATDTTLGGVIVPNQDADGTASPLSVDGSGNLKHDKSGVAEGTYTSLTVNKYGLVVSATQIEGSQLPEIDAGLITSGKLDGSFIADGSVGAVKLDDYSTCLIQPNQPPTGDYLGQFWLNPDTSQLYAYARGSDSSYWLSVGFGRLAQENLRICGTYNATDGTITTVTTYGVAAGLSIGPIPKSSTALTGCYLLCQTGGNAITLDNLVGKNHTPGDWIVAIEVAWEWVNVGQGGGDGGDGGGGGLLSLNDLLDVSITSARKTIEPVVSNYKLEDGDVLMYEGDTGLWKNRPIIDGGVF